MPSTARDDENITLPRAVRFPVELVPPEGFDPEHLPTWPQIPGCLEFVDGRLLYMPPCGDSQQDTVTDLVITLGAWIRQHPNHVLGTNEAGMRLGGQTRAADAAVWRRADAGPRTGGLRRTSPVLAVEVAGTDDTAEALDEKAAWYLRAGVALVWLVFPDRREVVVVTSQGRESFGADDRLPPHPDLPGLEPVVSELFVQLDQG